MSSENDDPRANGGPREPLSVTPDWFCKIDDSVWLSSDHISLEVGEEIASHFNVGASTKVLDCPCGRGLVSLPLARVGADITGWDLNEHFVRQAEDTFQKEGLKATFRIGDMREVRYPGGCDLLLNWYGSFGYFSDEENRRLLVRFAECLKPGGVFVTDNPNPERQGGMSFTKTFEDGHTTVGGLDPVTKSIVYPFPSRQGGPDIIMSMRLYSLDELRALAAEAGLEFVAAYAEHFRPFTGGEDRIIFVAKKK